MGERFIGTRLFATVTRRQSETGAVAVEHVHGTIVRVEPRVAVRLEDSGEERELPLRRQHLKAARAGEYRADDGRALPRPQWVGQWEEVHADVAYGSGTFFGVGFGRGDAPPRDGES